MLWKTAWLAQRDRHHHRHTLLTGSRGPARGGSHVAVWILKRLVSVFINACHLLSALPSLLQFGRGRLSLVAISFYALSLLFGPCRLSEFTLAGPRSHYRCMTPEGGSWDYPYRRIFADVIVYILRPNSKKPWSYVWTKCKSSKSWLSWAVCTISSFL